MIYIYVDIYIYMDACQKGITRKWWPMRQIQTQTQTHQAATKSVLALATFSDFTTSYVFSLVFHPIWPRDGRWMEQAIYMMPPAASILKLRDHGFKLYWTSFMYQCIIPTLTVTLIFWGRRQKWYIVSRVEGVRIFSVTYIFLTGGRLGPNLTCDVPTY